MRQGPSLLMWKQPGGVNIREWINADVRESSLMLYCRPGLFTKKLRLSHAQLPRIVNSFIDGKNQHIEYEVLPLNPALSFSITNLLRSGFTKDFHLLHMKAQSYDLLCDMLHYLGASNIHNEHDARLLSEYEKQRLQQARDILSTSFTPPPTIKNLARRIGLNETKFKFGFKRLFGATIHEYANYHRMQKAPELLQKTELPIADIAQAVGYEYQTSFTSAVRHFFGVTPKQLHSNSGRRQSY